MIFSKTWHDWYKIGLQDGLSPKEALIFADKKIKEAKQS